MLSRSHPLIPAPTQEPPQNPSPATAAFRYQYKRMNQHFEVANSCSRKLISDFKNVAGGFRSSSTMIVGRSSDRFEPPSFHYRPVRFGAGELSSCPAFVAAETVAGRSAVYIAPSSLCHRTIPGAFVRDSSDHQRPFCREKFAGNRSLETSFSGRANGTHSRWRLISTGVFVLFCAHPSAVLQSLFINKRALADDSNASYRLRTALFEHA